jgi:hypothetical protein
MWIWFTLFASSLAYIPFVLWTRANLTGSPLHWWKFQLHTDQDDAPTFIPDAGTQRFIVMIVFVISLSFPEGSDIGVHRYPFVFVVVALPLSVVRWLMGSGSAERNMPAATFAVEYIYSFSGALNVLMFLTHPLRLSFRKTATAGDSEWMPPPHLPWSRRAGQFSETQADGDRAHVRKTKRPDRVGLRYYQKLT